MRIFIIHRHTDNKAVEKLKEKILKTVSVDLLALECDVNNKKWFGEAKAKIKQSDVVLVALGETTKDGNGVNKEIKYSLKKHKHIFVIRLNDEDNQNSKEYKINDCLYKRDDFNNSEKPLFKEIELSDVAKIVKFGYDFDVSAKLEDTRPPVRDCDLIEQYKAYLATSEDVLTRRQNTSNFYTTLNTSLLTITVTVAGVLFGLSMVNALFVISIMLFTVSVVGVLLNLNWLKLLESYGQLNGAKIKVISEMEKRLPANIYDTEWKVMSEKLCDRKYVSFTAIEKRLPLVFVVLNCILLVASIIIFCFAIL